MASALKQLVPDAPAAALRLLAADEGPLQPPIRAEIFGPERFARHGHSLGLTHEAGLQRRGGAGFFPRLRSNILMLRRAHAYIAEQAAAGADVGPADEWLLDNFHLIEAQLQAAHEGLPRSYYRSLPVLQAEPLAGLPRIYGVAWAFVAHTDSAFDEELLVRFLVAYQGSRELSLAEMWALPTTLRVVLVENLRRLAERLATQKAARELANRVCDGIGRYDATRLQAVALLMARRGVLDAFLGQMAHRLQQRRSGPSALDNLATPATPAVLAWLAAALPSASRAWADHGAEQTADNLSVCDAVTSLRAVAEADWPTIVARTSVLMQQLLAWPLFAAEDAATRDGTLHAIERLARRSGRSEAVVTATLLQAMREPPEPAHRLAGSPQHWLQGEGRAGLAQRLGWHEPRWLAWTRRARGLTLPLYLATLVLATAALVALLLPAAAGAGESAWWSWQRWLTALLMLGPASEAAVALVNRIVSESARPQRLPRLALAQGIPPQHRVLVVVPGLLDGPQAAPALLHRLLLHHLANPEAESQYALLSDYADAVHEHESGDTALLQAALAEVTRLNALHPGGDAGPRFLLLHRERRWSETERCWMGWERKRGKLEELVHALASGAGGAFIDLGPATRTPHATPYIVTLDADTQLPPGSLRQLVGTAAHPAQAPLVDSRLRRVIAGHAILQPGMATPLPADAVATPFHTLFAGACGLDPYSAASSEVYQDLFGEGSFSGKGLLHVAALQAVLSDRLPPGQVLSHDLLEGCLARCAVLGDVTLLEPAPHHADVAAARLHRWTRGDWQLLPLLLQPLRWPLSALHRLKLLDNLRRSWVAPLSLATLLWALSGHGLPPLLALGLVLVGMAGGPLMGAVAGFAPSRDGIALRHFYRGAAAGLARAAWGALWHGVMLLHQARAAVDATGRALWRTAVSRRHLLQWTTAAAAQAASTQGLARLVRQQRGTAGLALACAALLLVAGTPWPWLSVLLCGVWALSPVWTALASRTWPGRRATALAPLDRAYLQSLARDTWRCFERCVGADDHHLPPDNLQTSPQEVLAHRTSPTNIGLYLLSLACAQRLGFITVAELLQRAAATLDSVDRLERHRGHLLNWYDTQTLAPLLPRYVSTVDSGNFSGHVLALAQACTELAAGLPNDADATDAAALQALAARCEREAWRAEFGFLYHPRRHLLHIGWRVAEQQLDAGLYDLLASESRLTSLLAIAKGDLPVRHWAALGRPFMAVGARAALRSWSGSMFEYLMPTLVLAEPRGSVLHDAGMAALDEQVAYAAARQVPWGISESAHAGRDHTLAYQYAPQGVPRLALRRTPPDELVVAPYATALALLLAPHRATLNLAALQAAGARGNLGFIEALDYTPALQTDGRRCTPVHTYMAHHQGMTLVALAQVLLQGTVQRWGMASAPVQAVASLLHERAPRELPAPPLAPAPARPPSAEGPIPALLREVLPGQQAVEPTLLLSNGRYRVTLRAHGAGSSQLGGIALTRQRDDALRDACGSFCYLRTAARPAPVSITQHPAPAADAHYSSTFHADRMAYSADWPELQAQMTVWVSPEDDVEFRQVTLHNPGPEPLEVELISAFEPVLAPAAADEAHPAFGGLFVRARWQPAQRALVFERQPRLDTEQPLLLAHVLCEGDVPVRALSGQTDRALWLGRNRATSEPLARLQPLPLAGEPVALDTGLDPVCVLAMRLVVPGRGAAQLTLATAASHDALTLQALVDKLSQPGNVQRASLMSATLAGIRRRSLALSAEGLAAVQLLTTALVLGLARPPVAVRDALGAAPSPLACDRRLLWRLGLSGERPLLLVSASAPQGAALVRSLAQALQLWSWGGLPCDLVVLNDEPASYQMALQREFGALQARHQAEHLASAGAFHLLRADDLSRAELDTLQALACVHLAADGRTLEHQVAAWAAWHARAQDRRGEGSGSALQAAARDPRGGPRPDTGRFDAASGAFSFPVGGGLRPPRPWINVLANPGFGSHVSEAGGGCTWAANSRLHQLTPWSNDPVADPPGEWLLLQDLSSLQAWSATPSAWGDPAALYEVTHGIGHTRISHQRGDLAVELRWCVDPQRAVRQLQLRLHNRGPRTLALRAVAVMEWLMGQQRSDRFTVHTSVQHLRLPAGRVTALLATQGDDSGGFGGSTAWLAAVAPPGRDDGWTCDRREFFDARGAPVLPDHLGQAAGGGLDPCATLSVRLTLAPGAQAEQVFLLGHSAAAAAVPADLLAAVSTPSGQRLAAVQAQWDLLLGATTVRTPDPLFDVMVNHWLLYQALSCRLWAKAGFYQAGGAFGFRDQLQDTLALAWTAPGLLREQILRCASRQYVQGDVQHWWHEPGGAGVRTHCADDLLWLPHALLHHLHAGGDAALLDEAVPFIEGPPVPEGREDLYHTPAVSAQLGSVYEHAARALDCSLRVGRHGLPLMGGGDWNDGMNRVGAGGEGESVWLAWFLCPLVVGLAPLARGRGDYARADRWEAAAAGWRQALEGPAWDGNWYRRAFFDDGQPLGSHTRTEACIDLIAQAWSVLSGAAPPGRQVAAMAAVRQHLADSRHGLLRLLHPPLVHQEPSAGYIQAYPAGVRENGGQYTHGAVWALMAQAALEAAGHAPASELPYRWFTWLSPAHRWADPVQGPAYGLEPYAVAGDVYTQPPYLGRGGWSWYTGAAAWLHRAAVESLFGLHVSGDRLWLLPALPPQWPAAEITVRRDGRSLRLQLVRGAEPLARAVAAGATPLRAGERVAWRQGAQDHTVAGHYVLQLPGG